MIIHPISDIHLEFAHLQYPAPAADVIVAAGDIDRKGRGVAWLSEQFGDRPVIYVAGNHEYYGTAIPKHTEQLRLKAKDTAVHFLERDAIEIDGVRFLGATLWTDFAVVQDRHRGMAVAGEVMTDYRQIRVSPQYRRLKPMDTLKWHLATVRWLREELARGGECVVVSHHAPSLRSVAEVERSDPITAAYASELEALIQEFEPRLWIHGHTHHAVDYHLGGTRVVSNPRGYADEPVAAFAPDLLIDI